MDGEGRVLLADAGLAHDEHRQRRRGEALDEREEPDHRRIGEHDGVVAEVQRHDGGLLGDRRRRAGLGRLRAPRPRWAAEDERHVADGEHVADREGALARERVPPRRRPLRLSRSMTRTPPASTSIRAWRRDTEASSRRRSAAAPGQ